MELDAFLSQPPTEVADRGFSQAVTLRRYREESKRAFLARSLALILLVALLAFVPAILLRDIPLLLTAVVSSPLMPLIGGGVFLLLLALQPKLLRD